MALYTIPDKVLFDHNFIKVIYGIAGRGKSSKLIKKLLKKRIPFIWATSTNKLARDAKERYGIDATTVCRALFDNEFGHFYKSAKNPTIKTIVIDEILQTDPKVIQWIKDNVGKYNIIVLTDTHQMLNASCNNFVTIFNDFLTWPNVVSDEGKTTLRARTQETKDKIEYLYGLDSAGRTAFVDDLRARWLPVIPYEQMPFTMDDIYIAHTNAIEDYIYVNNNLSLKSYDVTQLIPKGGIASKPPKSVGNYPILSQTQAERTHARSYYQLINIGSCTRYQGSECRDDQKLYYIISSNSVVTNREWYTVVSRCWDIKSIVIVVLDLSKPTNARSYRGKVIKDMRVLSIGGVEI